MDLQKFFSNNSEIIALIVVIIVVIGIIWVIQSNNNMTRDVEYMTNDDDIAEEDSMPLIAPEDEDKIVQQQHLVQPSSGSGVQGAPVPDFGTPSSETVNPRDLLPRSTVAAEFEEQFPVGAGDLSAKNFLTAGFSQGINTVSSSLRNANLQLRSDPYIPPKQVSPFLNSTMIPDLNRQKLEIGS